jgi:hypothetical protein
MTLCTHCGKPQVGAAGVQLNDQFFDLCHPDQGTDCYRLVTIYHHPIVDCLCMSPLNEEHDDRPNEDRDRRPDGPFRFDG